MALAAGKLDRRIEIMGTVEVGRDAWNNPVMAEQVVAQVWAAKKDVSDGEKVRAQQVGADITTRFTVRWSTTLRNIGPMNHIRFDGRIFDVSGVKEVGRREGLEITANARADTREPT